MEDARTTSPSAGSSDRRKTVSGALSDFYQAEANNSSNDTTQAGQTMRFPWSSPSAPSSPTLSSAPSAQAAPPSPGRASIHKRGLSSNILAKFNILRNAEDGRPPSRGEKDKESQSFKPRKSTDDDGEPSSPVSPVKGEHALTAALKPTKTRKRKGSLRKTALLGGKRLVHEGRERKNSLLQRSPASKQSSQQVQHSSTSSSAPPASYDTEPLRSEESEEASRQRRRFGYASLDAMSSSDSGWSEPAAVTAARLSLVTDHQVQQGVRTDANGLGSPLDLKSPTSQTSYTSTTDDDDVLTFDRPANGYAIQQRDGLALNPLLSASTGYFPPVTSASEVSLSRRRSSKQSRSSPLSHSITALASYPEPEPHDYTETEYWGWVILFVTWLTFAVGMGSCLEIWSWAWDVGETPYAPPELEDDPTLPIVGYYPALIVLTGVVAWVWITVAWVGMKYFRHAKIEV